MGASELKFTSRLWPSCGVSHPLVFYNKRRLLLKNPYKAVLDEMETAPR